MLIDREFFKLKIKDGYIMLSSMTSGGAFLMYDYFLGRTSNIMFKTKDSPTIIGCDKEASHIINKWLDSYGIDLDVLICRIIEIFDMEVSCFTHINENLIEGQLVDESNFILELIPKVLDNPPVFFIKLDNLKYKCNLDSGILIDEITDNIGEVKIVVNYSPLSQQIYIESSELFSITFQLNDTDLSIYQDMKDDIKCIMKLTSFEDILLWFLQFVVDAKPTIYFEISKPNNLSSYSIKIDSGKVEEYKINEKGSSFVLRGNKLNAKIDASDIIKYCMSKGINFFDFSKMIVEKIDYSMLKTVDDVQKILDRFLN